MGKGKRRVIILILSILLIVVVIILSIIAVGQVGKKNEEKKLLSEVRKIAGLQGKRDYAEWPLRCKGEYKEIERAIRKYDELFYTRFMGLNDIDGVELLDELTTLDNLQNDAPEFAVSNRKITEWEEQWENCYEELIWICSDEGIMGLLASDVDEYYSKLYYELVTEETGLNVLAVRDALDKIYQYYDKRYTWITGILDILKDNPGKWEIKDGKIYFANAELEQKFGECVDKIIQD